MKGFYPFTPLGAVHPDPYIGVVPVGQSQKGLGETGGVAA